jgi:hypothetical protein
MLELEVQNDSADSRGCGSRAFAGETYLCRFVKARNVSRRFLRYGQQLWNWKVLYRAVMIIRGSTSVTPPSTKL